MRILSACFALIAILLSACAPTARPGERVRVVTALTEEWRFLDGPASVAQASSPEFDDSAWKPVSLPHSWNRLGEYRTTRSRPADDRQGEGWYRLKIDGVRLPRRDRHVLAFEGAGNVVDVWVNGVHVGRHAGAFSRFRFDITDHLKRDGINVIAVRADNSKPAPGSVTEHVAPLLGDFFIHGGLYRPVSLVSVDAAHIDLMDHGSSGVFVRTASVSAERAELELRIKTDVPRGTDIRTTVTDRDGRMVTASPIEKVIEGRNTHRQSLAIAQPRLWDGRRDPHLYTARVELLRGGQVVDRVDQRFGVRSFRVDPAQGFFLNGRHMPLQGVSRHQDMLDQGWALSRADHERDMQLIEELGANTVRFAHYQHAQEWFGLSDESGMIVWAEIPFVNKVSFGDMPASPEFTANARQQLIEMIRQHYNSPAVVTWGIGNEMDIDLAFNRLGPKADPRPLLDELHALSKAEDPDRPTVLADCCEATPGDKAPYLPISTGHADLVGYNRYFGWYYGKPADLGPHLDAMHKRHPKVPISVSEYGAGGATSQHSDNPEGGPISSGGRPHPEDYQAWFHEQSWPQLRARRYVWANWIWNMFDFSSPIRQEGDASDINDKGLVTFDRAIRKDAFFYYKANWSDVPVLHIAQRRYVERAYPVTDVRLYSNAATARLIVNGRDLGERPCKGGICVFAAVTLDAGANRIEARAGALRDSVEWRAPDAAAGLAMNVGSLTGYVDVTGQRVGSDNWFIGGAAKRPGNALRKTLAARVDTPSLDGYRDGAFRYSIPVPNGRWRVTLLLGNPDDKASRRYGVDVEGRAVLRDVSELPAGLTKRAFDVDLRDGVLDLNFTGQAALFGIEVRPAS
ncbi:MULTISPECIES: glycoside hydrolase family 2 protein [unclassified Sphingomonas]|uniref:glycoside hydrolase family 2 protein n=1 Tax=unclassified Sphingomonas TaxID=196159 RepID=UPI002150E6A9|nr:MULTISPECIES: glycoside hydrolase family 2 protein [unclassified Sphingomonas]MCR5872355.1 glycoside hydrolase family 2 protein [Sphingomonas sp. J344]UUX99350.1 glycoside hydrolase family 2 protein [Sphingomonas sp. J315]